MCITMKRKLIQRQIVVQPGANSATVVTQSREDPKTRKQTDLCAFMSLGLRVEALYGYFRRLALVLLALSVLVMWALGGVAIAQPSLSHTIYLPTVVYRP